jgi:hypothetical protein
MERAHCKGRMGRGVAPFSSVRIEMVIKCPGLPFLHESGLNEARPSSNHVRLS